LRVRRVSVRVYAADDWSSVRCRARPRKSTLSDFTPVGLRGPDGWTLTVWSRNLLNKDYYELLTAAPGNTVLYVGQPGDSRTFGVTLRVTCRSGQR
jgi:outer membrane receptor protein involved in Fe transport